MNRKYFCPRFIVIPTLFVLCLLLNASVQAQKDALTAEKLAELYKAYKTAKTQPCGKRDEAIRIGREIVEKYDSAWVEGPVIDFVKKDTAKIEAEDKKCKPDYSAKSTTDLYADFETAKKLPCGKRDEAIVIAKVILERFDDGESNSETNKQVIDWAKKQIFVIEEEDQACRIENSLVNLYENYKTAKKSPCGERDKAIVIGKRIVELYPENDSGVPFYVKSDIPKIEEADRICQRNALYNNSYKIKDWRGFLAVSKEIIAEEGDSRLALDVMLTFVAVGFDLTAYEKSNAYNSETVTYAKKAIELIEAGVRTQSRWGVFEPYETKSKALGWLNYTIGYISYFRFKENKKAIPYFYQSAQYDMEFKHDAFVYQAVAIYYFDNEVVTASSLTVNDFITKANASTDNPFNDGFGNTAKETAKQYEIGALYTNLIKLYNLRYNLYEGENVNDLADYIQKIINRPLIDPSAKIYRRKSTQAQIGRQ